MQDTSHPRTSDPAQTVRTTTSTDGHLAKKAHLEQLSQRAEARSRVISTARLFTILPAVALALVLGFGYLPAWMWWVAGVLAVAFAGLVVAHVRLDESLRRLAAAISFHQWALSRIEGRFDQYPARGERFAEDEHPYTADLNIFGDASLFQLLDLTHTRRGEDCLAAWLSRPANVTTALERQAAVRELAEREAMREELSILGSLIAVDKPNPDPMLTWAEGTPVLSPIAWVQVVAYAVPAITASLWGLVLLDVVPPQIALASLGAQWVLGISLLGKIEPIAGKVSSREGALARYRSMLEVIERESFTSPYLAGLRSKLLGEGHGQPSAPPASAEGSLGLASSHLRKLSNIVGFLNARQNEAFRVFTGPLLLWDVHCVLALERWQKRVGKNVRTWLEVIGEFEATASLAAFAHDHPDYAFPTVSSAPAFRATGLGHPLLAPQGRVTNDVTLRGAGTALLVTGSNMSGKSTLLRAMGINTVLALAGAPTAAREFTVGTFELRTSMWARDSLAKGVSHFYAELEKLKRVVDGIEAPLPLLFLLDEILQGTNSRERVIGARAVLRHLLAHRAMGAVSTHDLGLLDLEGELDEKLDKVHFEEQVTESEGKAAMTFDYRLRPGVVRSTNALRLMKRVGIDVELV